MRKISNYYFLSDDTLLFYVILTDRQTKPFKCYAWYETKELLTVTKTYIIIIDILMLIISIDIVIIIIIIIITTTVIIISIITIFVKSY